METRLAAVALRSPSSYVLSYPPSLPTEIRLTPVFFRWSSLAIQLRLELLAITTYEDKASCYFFLLVFARHPVTSRATRHRYLWR